MLALGKKLGKRLSGGDVILLTGELGAGKTVLCKGIAKGLGVKAPVVSPTFTIMNEYFGRVKFCHFDAYRLEDAEEAVGAGLTDFIGNDECLCAVEWWENIESLFDGLNVVHITIEKTAGDKREVTIEYNGSN
ncbi:MAG: tRNA (adenosine(37)-N6)-threonylcarbamoyltransferase complex ATPase subunit type 1 TsaE [Clostridiales bacterium]|nr:tRNA (adenosine(37)-N6)-threonylcarbamoyltransferase complex ATPase subunit type 1 TsaE [Clostridiales bacterium]